jgi:hypothetical protein
MTEGHSHFRTSDGKAVVDGPMRVSKNQSRHSVADLKSSNRNTISCTFQHVLAEVGSSPTLLHAKAGRVLKSQIRRPASLRRSGPKAPAPYSITYCELAVFVSPEFTSFA